jgi:Domain of unknown function (DU1801)
MGKLVEIKTKETEASVDHFINKVDNEQQRKDSQQLVKLMQKVSKEKPKMWGTAIIGFGNIRYKSPKTGREVDWLKIGFSPRKANLSLYLPSVVQTQKDLLKKLGKHKTGGGCLYINKLEDIDIKILSELIKTGLKQK